MMDKVKVPEERFMSIMTATYVVNKVAFMIKGF